MVHFSSTGKLNVALGGRLRGRTPRPQPHLRAQAETEVHPAVAQATRWVSPSVHPVPKGAALQCPGLTSEPSPHPPLRGNGSHLSPVCVETQRCRHPSPPFSRGPGDRSALLHLQVCFWKPISITGLACQEAAPPAQEVTWGPESPELLG